MHAFPHCLKLAVLLFAGLVVGCGGSDGPQLAEVSGSVTMNGAPVPRLSITFTPEQSGGSPSFGVTDASGHYTLLYSTDKRGAMIGAHRVDIQAVEPETDESGEPLPGQESVVIPAAYSQPGALKANVEAGSNTIDFDLKPTGP